MRTFNQPIYKTNIFCNYVLELIKLVVVGKWKPSGYICLVIDFSEAEPHMTKYIYLMRFQGGPNFDQAEMVLELRVRRLESVETQLANLALVRLWDEGT